MVSAWGRAASQARRRVMARRISRRSNAGPGCIGGESDGQDSTVSHWRGKQVRDTGGDWRASLEQGVRRSEETAAEPILVRARAPLPTGVPKYVTARGLAELRSDLRDLETERTQADSAKEDDGRAARAAALSARLAELTARIGSAVVPDVAPDAAEEVRFGTTVTVRSSNGQERRYHIVGVDEADARAGKVAFVAPLARTTARPAAGRHSSRWTRPAAKRPWRS